MNELIFELAEQAEEYATTRHPVSNIALSVNNEKFVKKFAELILKECFQYLENEEDRLWDLSEKEEDKIFQSNFEICAEKCRDVHQGLKEHFGVEE